MSAGTIRVYTFKDRRKLLSPVAHDLRLSLERFDVDRDGDRVTVRCPTDAFAVDGRMVGGALEPMREKDRRDVLDNVRRKVLQTRRHAEAVFEGTLTDGRVSGELSLVGRRAPLSFTVEQTDGRLRGRVDIQPTRWGITPFKALLGAISLEDRVVVEIDVPA